MAIGMIHFDCDLCLTCVGVPNEPARNSRVPPHGIALLKNDLSELQLSIRYGTPVTIICASPARLVRLITRVVSAVFSPELLP